MEREPLIWDAMGWISGSASELAELLAMRVTRCRKTAYLADLRGAEEGSQFRILAPQPLGNAVSA